MQCRAATQAALALFAFGRPVSMPSATLPRSSPSRRRFGAQIELPRGDDRGDDQSPRSRPGMIAWALSWRCTSPQIGDACARSSLRTEHEEACVHATGVASVG